MENLDKRLSHCQGCKRFHINPRGFRDVWISCGKFGVGIEKIFEGDSQAISAYLSRIKKINKKYPKCKEDKK